MVPKFLTTLVASLALFATSSAFVVPAEGEDGIYTVHVDETGQEVHTKIADLDPTTALNVTEDAAAALDKRAVSWPSGTYPVCVNLQWLGHWDFYDGGAWNYFYNACYDVGSQRFYNGDSLYSRYGTAVAYMCSYSNSGNPCNIQEWVDAVNWLAGTCSQRNGGNMVSGEFSFFFGPWCKVPGH